jgi:sulfonate transport system substrate-binding protein
MTKKTPTLVVGLALAAAMLAGCAAGPSAAAQGTAAPSATAPTTTAAAPKPDKIAVTYVTSPLNVPSIVEKKIGAFSEAFGTDVTYSNLTTGPEQTAALASGDIQFLFAVGSTSVILAAANGADIAIVDTYSRSPQAFMLVTGPTGPTSAAALKGKTIAGPKGTILHQLLLAYLATAGLTAKDVNFVNMTIPAAQAALASGSADVALLAGPAAYQAVAAGDRKVTDGTGLVGATIVDATSRTFATQHPDVVAAFVKAHQAVLAYMDAHPDDTLAAAAAATGLSADAVRAMYPQYDFSSTVTAADLADLQATQQFMLANGMIEKPVDTGSLVLARS